MNSDPLTNQNGTEKWLSMSQAAEHTPYSAEYLSLLARKGKLASKKINGVWYTTRPALDEYMQKQMLRAQVLQGSKISNSQFSIPNQPSSTNDQTSSSSLQIENSKIENSVASAADVYDPASLKQLRTMHADIRAYMEKNGMHMPAEREPEPIEPVRVDLSKLPVYLPQLPTKNAVAETLEEVKSTRTSEVEKALERVLDKKLPSRGVTTTAVGAVTAVPRRAWKHVSGSRVLLAVCLVAAIVLTVAPVPFVFSAFENGLSDARSFLTDANTVMGFRPGTHKNELLLLDKNGNIAITGSVETGGQLSSYAADGIAPITVESKTLVKNLNAEYLNGASSSDFTLAFVTKNGAVTTEDVSLEGSVEVGKTLLVKGATKLLHSLSVDGDLSVFGNAEFNQALAVLGPATFSQLLTAEDNLVVKKNIDLHGSLDAGGAVIGSSGSFGSLGVSGDLSATGKIALGSSANAITFSGKNITLDRDGNETISGSFAAGDATFSTITATSTTLTGALTADHLTITGSATSTFAGPIEFSGTVALSGTTTLSSLGVTGSTTLADLLVSGSTTLQNFTAENSTTTNATTTSLFASIFNAVAAKISSLVADSVSVGALTATNSTTTNATTTSFYSDTASSSNLFAGQAVVTLGQFGNTTTTNATTTTLYSDTASSTRLFFTSASGGDLALSGSLSVGGTTLGGDQATFPHLLVTGSSTLQDFTFAHATGTSATTTNFFTTNLIATNFNATNDTIGNLIFTNATGTNATTTNLFSTTASSTNLFSTNFNLGTGSIGSLNVGTTLTATGGLSTLSNLLLTGSSTLQNFTFNNATGTSATTTNFFSTNLTATNQNVTNTTITTATTTNLNFTNATGTNLFITNLTGTKATFTGATTTNLFSTTASSTNLFSTNFNLGTGSIGALTVGPITSGLINGQTISSAANFTGSLAIGSSLNVGTTLTATGGLSTLSNLLLTGSSTLQNFTFNNATGTSATTTNFFATTASSTKLFSTSGTIGSLLFTNATGTSATTTNLFTTNLTATNQNITNLLFTNATGTSATTTNFFSANGSFTSLGVGTSTTTPGALQTTGDVYIGGALTIAGSLTSSVTNGQIQFLAIPQGTGISQGTVYINPASAGTNNVLLGLAVGGTEKARIDSGGNVKIIGTFNSTNTTGTNLLSGNLQVNGNTTLGTNASNTVSLLGQVASDIVPSLDNTYNLGSPTNRWANFYAETASFNTIDTSSTTGATLIINAANATNDTEDSSLQFSRGTASPNAILKWDSTNKRFDFNNFPVHLQNVLQVGGTGTSTVAGPLWLTGLPQGTNLQDGTLYINPSAASVDNTLLGVGVNGSPRFSVDAEGDTSVYGSFNVQNAINPITGDTLTIGSKLELNGGAIKDSGGTTRLTIGSTNAFTGDLTTTGNLNVNSGTGTITSGLVNGQTISSAANFTGSLAIGSSLNVGTTLTATGGLSTLSNLLLTGSSTLQNFTFNNATGTSATTTNFFATNIAGTSAVIANATTTNLFSTTASSTNLFSTVASIGGSAFNVTSGGNVGIGITNPSSKLVVSGGDIALPTSASGLVFANSQSIRDGGPSGDLTLTTPTTAAKINLNTTNGNIILNPGTGSIGIGTSTPQGLLQVARDVSALPTTGVYGQIEVTLTSTPTDRLSLGYSSSFDSGFVQALQNGTGFKSLLLNPSGGNVGVGTSSPFAKFSLAGDAYIGGNLTATGTVSILGSAAFQNFTFVNATGTSATTTNFFSTTASSTNLFGTNFNLGTGSLGSATISSASIGSLSGASVSSLTANFLPKWNSGTFANSLVYDNGTNVGIGTTTPGTLLTVSGTSAAVGTFNSTNATGGYVRFQNSGANNGLIGSGGQVISGGSANDFGITSSGTGGLVLGTNGGSARVTVTNGGNVGVGVTNPASLLAVGGAGNATYKASIISNNANLLLDTISSANSELFFGVAGTPQIRLGLFNAKNEFRIRDEASTTDRFVIDNTGNAGLGTDTPSDATDQFTGPNRVFEIAGATSGVNAPVLSLSRLATGQVAKFYLGVQSDKAFDIYDSTNAADRLNISSAGNVGIGVRGAASKLGVSGGATIGSSYASVAAPSNGLLVQGNVGIGTTTPDQELSIYSASTPSVEFSTGAGGAQWTTGIDTADGGKFKIASSTTVGTNTRFTIDGNGNVGIGTASPSNRLQVTEGRAGAFGVTNWTTNLAIDDASLPGIAFGGSATGVGAIIRETAGNLTFITGPRGTGSWAGQERLRIDSSGNVGIGKTNPSTLLDVAGTASSTGLQVNGNGTITGALTAGTASVGSLSGAAVSSLTANFLPKWNSGTFANSLVYDNGTSVGIGTTSPNALLNIHDNNNGDFTQLILDNENALGGVGIDLRRNNTARAAQIKFSLGTTPEWYLGEVRNGGGTIAGFAVSTSSDLNVSGPAFFINKSTGNVGIGTAAPGNVTAALLQVGDSTTANSSARIILGKAVTSSESNLPFIQQVSTLVSGTGNDLALGAQSSNGGILFYTGGSTASVPMTGSNAARMVIDASGNVGIGTTTPQAKLSVEGGNTTTIRVGNTSSTGYAGYRIYNDTYSNTRTIEMDYSGSSYSGSLLTSGPTGESGSLATTGAFPLALGTNNTARLTIDSSGNVGIGITNPSSKLYVFGTGGTAADGVKIQSKTSGNIESLYTGLNDFYMTAPGTTNPVVTLGGAAGSFAGNVGIGTTQPATLLNINGTTTVAYKAGYEGIPNSGVYSSGSAGFYPFLVSGVGTAVNDTVVRYASGNNNFALQHGTTNVLVADQNGNIGIGTTAPGYLLDVSSTTQNSVFAANTEGTWAVAQINGVSGVTGSARGIKFGDHSGTAGAGIVGVSKNTSGGREELAFITSTSNTAAERLRIDENGNVGIGTSTPTGLLELYRNDSTTSGNSNRNLLVHNAGTGDAMVGFLANNDTLGFGIGVNSANSSFIIGAHSTNLLGNPILTIKNTGNVGIGKTNPSTLLDVAGTASSTGLQVNGNTTITGTETLNTKLNISVASGSGIQQLASMLAGGNATGNGAELALGSTQTVAAYLQGIQTTTNTGDFALATQSSGSKVERLRILGASGNVGIGTSTPRQLLSVSNSSAYAQLALEGSTSTGGIINFGDQNSDTNSRILGYGSNAGSDTNNLRFDTAGSERVRITSGGILGVGYSADQGGGQKLQVNSGAYFNGNVGVGVTNPLHALDISGNAAIGSGYVSAGTVPSNGLIVQGGVGLGYSAISSGALDVNGNVGIGTTAPVAQVTVNGSGDTSGVYLRRTGSNGFGIYNEQVSTVETLKISHTSNDFGANSVILALNELGNIGIGTTTPSRQLTVDGGASNTHILLQNSSAGGTIARGFDLVESTAGNAQVWNYEPGYLAFGTSNAERVRIDSSGNVGIGTTSPSSLLTVGAGTATTELTVDGGSTGFANAAIVLKAESGSAVRGLGTYYFDNGSGTEWYAGRPYNTSDSFVINRALTGAHNAASASTTNGVLFDINSSGNVGIGKTNPATTLDVAGTASSTGLQVNGNSTITGIITSGLINGQTISSAANFTGSLAAAGLVSFTNTTDVAASTGALKVSGGVNIAKNLAVAGGTIYLDNASGSNFLQYTGGVETLYQGGTAGFSQKGGSVGIGTTSPSALLDLGNGSSWTANNAQAILTRGQDNNFQLYAANGANANTSGTVEATFGLRYAGTGDAATLSFIRGSSAQNASIAFNTNGSEHMRIDSSGNVGIGTTTPDGALTVDGGTAMTSGWNRTADLEATFPVLGFASNKTKWGGIGYDYSVNNGTMRFWTAASTNDITAGSLVLSLNTSSSVFSSGTNVGIGANPLNKLDVSGGAVIGATYAGTNTAPSNGLLVQGNVGIGTTTPSSALAVSGGASIGADYNTAAPSNSLIVEGNVGIGTTNPYGRLQVGTTNYSGHNTVYSFNDFGPVNIMERDGGSDSYLINNAMYTSGNQWQRLLTGGANRIGFDSDAAGAIDFKVAPTGTAGTTFSWTNAMTILSSGNVGVGTTAPGSALEVSMATSDTSNGLRITGTGTGAQSWNLEPTSAQTLQVWRSGLRLGGFANDGSFWAGGASGDTGAGASFYVNGTTDDVGIGTTNPGTKLDVNGTEHIGSSTLTTGAQLEIDKSSTYNTESTAGLYIASAVSDSALLLGADAANDLTYIQSMQNGTSYTTRPLAINPNGGNVGIGTTNIGKKFEVFGDLVSRSSATAGSAAAIYTADSNGANIWTNASYDGASPGTGWVRVLTATPSGNVGIGTTTPASSLTIQAVAGTNPLNIASSTGASLLSLDQTGALSAKLKQLTADYTVDSGSNSISVGDVVSYINGKVQRGVPFNVGTPVAASSTASNYTSAAALDSTHFVVAYESPTSGTGGLAAIVGTISGTTISYGTEFDYNISGNTSPGYVSVAALDSTHFVTVYISAGSAHVRAVVSSVSGTTITAGSFVTIGSSTATDALSVAALDSSHFIAAYANPASSVFATAASVSGTTITPGTEVTIDTVPTNGSADSVAITGLDSTHFALAYNRTDPSNPWDNSAAVIGSVSGTTITHGTALALNATSGDTYISVAPLDSTHFLVAHSSKVNVATYSGTTISSFNSSALFDGGTSSYESIAKIDSTHFIVSYVLSSNAKAIVGAVSGTSISYNTAFTLVSSVTPTFTSAALLSSTNFVTAYKVSASLGNLPYAVAANTGLDDSGTTLLGMATTAASPGGTVTVASNGIVTGLSGLTAGSTYYYSNATGATTTSETYKIGVALSTTSILLDSGSGAGSDQFFGDAVFANAFRIAEAAGTPQGLVFKNQLGRDIMTIDEDGNLSITGSFQGGISTTTLQSLLASGQPTLGTSTSMTVGGSDYDFLGSLMDAVSSRLTASGTTATSTLAFGDALTQTVLGRLASSTSTPVTIAGQIFFTGLASSTDATTTDALLCISPDGGVHAGDCGGVSELAATASSTAAEVSSLAARVTTLESSILTASSTASSFTLDATTTQTIVGSVLDALGATIADGVTHFKDVVVVALTVGSADKPSGITIYDTDTGAPYCLTVKSGVTVSTAGECGSPTPLAQPNPAFLSSSPGTATTTDTTTSTSTSATTSTTTDATASSTSSTASSTPTTASTSTASSTPTTDTTSTSTSTPTTTTTATDTSTASSTATSTTP